MNIARSLPPFWGTRQTYRPRRHRPPVTSLPAAPAVRWATGAYLRLRCAGGGGRFGCCCARPRPDGLLTPTRRPPGAARPPCKTRGTGELSRLWAGSGRSALAESGRRSAPGMGCGYRNAIITRGPCCAGQSSWCRRATGSPTGPSPADRFIRIP